MSPCAVEKILIDFFFFATELVKARAIKMIHKLETHKTAVLIVTVSHRTFSGQFRHLSGQIFPLSNQINTSSYVHREYQNVRTFSVAYYKHCNCIVISRVTVVPLEYYNHYRCKVLLSQCSCSCRYIRTIHTLTFHCTASGILLHLYLRIACMGMDPGLVARVGCTPPN